MTKSLELFLDLLLVCTGAKDSLSCLYTEEQWNNALELAQEQAIEGVLLSAIERLKANENLHHSGKTTFEIPKMVLLQWIGAVQMLEANSKKIAEASETVVKYFRENGFACNILKGSAVARYYPQPERRQSGDVDVWVDGGRKKIYDFARKFDKDGKLYGVNYHHIHFHLIEDVHVEVHIWPSYLSSPLRNWRLHQFCNLHRPTMDTDKPSLEFDRVFIMLHAYLHFCGHGVGLRQIMDYCYVLKQGFTEAEQKDAVEGMGSRFNGQVLGTFGKYGVLSFNGNKMITTSGGGALICRSAEEANEIMWYATQARDAYPYYQHTAIGYNYRMSNVCAGIGRGQMKVLDAHIAHHKHVQALYEELLKDVKGVHIHKQPSDPRYDSNFWLCAATLDPEVKIQGQENAYKEVIKTAVGGAAGVIHQVDSATTDCQPNENVEALRVFMLNKKIEARPTWKPMHKQPVYAGAPVYTKGVEEEIFKVGFCLPAGPYVTDDDVKYIVECIKEAIALDLYA